MAAAVPPIDLRCVRAGPDAPVQSPAAHPLVVATAFLRWGPAAAAPSGAARVQLPQHAMLRVFGRRLRLSASPADSPADRHISARANEARTERVFALDQTGSSSSINYTPRVLSRIPVVETVVGVTSFVRARSALRVGSHVLENAKKKS